MKIKILYFAHVRDITKKEYEIIDINSGNMDEIKKIIFNKYPEIKYENNLLIAVNDEYYNNQKIKENDAIAFFPPVSGG
jgi:molybdopterin synthase sulfur carrier subunit